MSNTGMNICRKFSCTTVINAKHLFCATHFRLVPKEIQSRIQKYGRYGTREAYNQAVHDAIEAVNEESQKRLSMGIKDVI